MWWAWLSGNSTSHSDKVSLCRAQLVLKWVTVWGYISYPDQLSLAIPTHVCSIHTGTGQCLTYLAYSVMSMRNVWPNAQRVWSMQYIHFSHLFACLLLYVIWLLWHEYRYSLQCVVYFILLFILFYSLNSSAYTPGSQISQMKANTSCYDGKTASF